MFGSTLGGQISWLIPFAAIALIGTLILIGRRPRTDLARASVLLWGGWIVPEFFVLSFQQGTQHPYYISAMAPTIAALTGIGAVAFYQAYRRSGRLEPGTAAGDRRDRRVGRSCCCAVPRAGTRGWPGRSPRRPPWRCSRWRSAGWRRARR